nr:MAG TPA: hypothetical protein [Caudoviricetes sp.]
MPEPIAVVSTLIVPSVTLRPSPTFTTPRLSLVAELILAILFSTTLTPLTCTSSTLPPAAIYDKSKYSAGTLPFSSGAISVPMVL